MNIPPLPDNDTSATLLDFKDCPAQRIHGIREVVARGQNFGVQWLEGPAEPCSREIDSADESMVLVLDGQVTARAEGSAHAAGPASVAILAPGKWTLELAPHTRCAVLSSLRENAVSPAINAEAYAQRRPELIPVGPPYRHAGGTARAQVFAIDAVRAAPDKPRIKMLQSATLSINWVEYQGPRDRSSLSPHAHRHFEQGSLALAGQFVHHLRTEWGPDANQWTNDVHARLGSPSLMVVPARTIHTSEGVGPGRHLLIDIFSPPREDFIANGWVFNAGDYTREDAP